MSQEELMTCPVSLGKHVVDLAVEAKPIMCFSQHTFFLLVYLFFLLGGNLRVSNLERNSVFAIYLLTVESLCVYFYRL